MHDVDRLSSLHGVKVEAGWFVERLRRSEGGFALSLHSAEGGTSRQIRAGRVFLATGAPVSTRLALDCAGLYDRWFAFGHTFSFAFAVLLPRLLGSVPPDAGQSLALLSWELDNPRLSPRIGGSLYSPTGVPDSEIVRFMPFTRPGAIAVWKYLRGAMLIGNGFLSSDFSCTKVRLQRPDESLEFRTEPNPDIARNASGALRILSRSLRRAGAIVIPSSLKMAQAGADFHYGATLPHGGGGINGTDMLGQLANLKGLHIVDGAVLPRLPSRHPTLTIMANADRIARTVPFDTKIMAPG
jgi:hypothetical protein